MTGGQVHDSQVVGEVLDTPRPPLAVTADKAYDSEKVRQQIKDEGALPVIPSRSTATQKAYCPKRFYRRRHKIENYFCRIKDWRRIATRYDKLARNFLAAATLVGALYWIKLCVQTLALQLRFLLTSESMSHHDSEDHGWREHRSRRRLSFGHRRYGM